MTSDRDALDRLYEDCLTQYPPGPRREAAIARRYGMARFTDCRHWKPRRTQPVLKLVVSTPDSNTAPDHEVHGEKCLNGPPLGST